MKYCLSNDTWGEEEISAINNVISSKYFSMGQNVKKMETSFAEHFGSKYAVMSSSGSAANLLSIAALVYSKRLKRGDEVLVTAVSWSTTYFPLEQMGLKIRLVDIDKNTLNIDINKIEEAITKDTRAIFAVNLLGNPNDFAALFTICSKYDLILLEDNCESMGASYNKKMAGTFGLLGTFSTFYSHHLCTMEGGITVTDDEELYHYMLAIRAHGWTRNLPNKNTLHNKNENDFYESFCFVVPGFNLRPLEMEGAIGVEQLKKLNGFVEIRRKNARYFSEKMSHFNSLLTQYEIGESSWFGFSVVLKEQLMGKRDLLIDELRKAEIEVRPIVAGNFARQPVFKYMNASVSGQLEQADYIHDNGFFVGNHSVDISDSIDLLYSVFIKMGIS